MLNYLHLYFDNVQKINTEFFCFYFFFKCMNLITNITNYHRRGHPDSALNGPSCDVGFINLLPLPAFDGGHILFLIIEKIKGSPVKPTTENMIHTVGLFLLMALMVYITFNDIIKLF